MTTLTERPNTALPVIDVQPCDDRWVRLRRMVMLVDGRSEPRAA